MGRSRRRVPPAPDEGGRKASARGCASPTGRRVGVGRVRAAITAVASAVALGVGWTAPAQAQEVAGGAYLYRYQPVNFDEADGRTEVYAAFLQVAHRTGPWEVYVEARGRDDRLRSFYPGNFWFQEAWASYRVSADTAPASLRVRAGKTYQVTGRFWDGSFFGNIHYFDGLKLNPQWLVEASGEWDAGAATVGYRAQYITNSDRVSGALPGRDFETLEDVRDQHGFSGRGTVSFPLGERFPVDVRLGGTVFHRGVGFDDGLAIADGTERILHVSGDLEVTAGDATVYAEWLHRGAGDLTPARRLTVAGSQADYLLAGGQMDLGRLQLRYNGSRADYEDLARVEWIHQPGVTWAFTEGISGIVEYDYWTADLDGDVGEESETLDQSLNIVLLVTL